MRNVKLEPAKKHNAYVKSMEVNKFESINLPECLPPLPAKPQVTTIFQLLKQPINWSVN